MSNVKQFVSKDAIHQQACEWISRIDRGLSKEERRALLEWAKDNPAHQKQLFEVAELWDDLSSLNELSGLFPLRGHEPKTRRTFADRTRWGIAASFAFLAFSAAIWSTYVHINNSSQHLVAKAVQAAETAVGEQKPITLADGSVVHLNTNSEISVHFTDSLRRVSLLRGEAHFDVFHDPSRPFVVEAGDNSVTAVGTAFNVERVGEKDFDVLVTEGKVLVKQLISTLTGDANGPETTTVQSEQFLEAGEKATFRGLAAQSSTLSLDQVQKDLAWQQGMLVFQGESLLVALKEVSRYTSVRFEIPQESLKDMRVAGYFKAGDIDGLLYALKNNFNIDHQMEGEKVILRSGNR